MAKKERGVFEKVPGSGIWWVRWCDQHGRLHREKVGPKGLAKDVYAKRKLEVREMKLLSTMPRIISSSLKNHPDIEARFHHDVTSGNIGTVGELIVCTDLIIHGFIVFRAVTVNAFCDLIVEKNGKLFRVEVKVAPKPERKMIREGIDVLAVVGDKGITYVDPKTLEPIENWEEVQSWESSKKTVIGG